MADKAMIYGDFGNFQKLTRADVMKIYQDVAIGIAIIKGSVAHEVQRFSLCTGELRRNP